MAKASINSGGAVESVHTRTTAGTEESQVAVIGIDGSDSVVGADTANGLDVDVTRLPGTPAQEHTTAASPNSARLSDGAAFYNTNTGAQLPSALVSGRLDVSIGASPTTVPVSLAAVPTVTEKQDQPAATSATWTSATGANTAVTVATTGYGTANVFIVVPTTVTAGVIAIEVSNDGGTTYVQGGAVRVDNGYQESTVPLAFAPGINGSRMYAVSVDAMTQVRARLSTVIAGAGNVVVTVSTVAGGIEPFVAVRPRKVATYRAVFGPAIGTRPNWLANAFGAAGRKQFATIHHAAAATKTVRLRRVRVGLMENTVAALVLADLMRITTAPATGNPAVTPGILDNADSAAEATCLSLPTTAGTEGALISRAGWDAGVIAGASTTAQGAFVTWQDLLPPGNYDDESKAPVIRAGVLEGWAVTVDVNAATNPKMLVEVEFTEEAP